MARPQSQFSYSCSVCERFIYSAYSATGKYVDRSWEYIKIAHRHMNVDCLNWDWEYTYINGILVAV
jgi:hypothetical protein